MFSKCSNNNKCPKGGVKIRESGNNIISCSNENNLVQEILSKEDLLQEEFYQKIKNQNKHTGVRISKGDNEYNIDPFDNINPFSNPDGKSDFKNVVYNNSSYENMDINISNYSIDAIYKLFGVQNKILTDEVMKEAKKIALKAHPDKCRLDPKYFLFFSEAYKRLFNIYEFQNKTSKKNEDTIEFYNANNNATLDTMFDKKASLKDPGNFNQWFNEQFDKYKLEDTTSQSGYGDWLKSNDDIVETTGNVSTKEAMSREIEKRKKEVQSITKYNGVTTSYSTGVSSSSLMDYNSNFTSGSLFSSDGMGYTDLRQAYVESVIPVTEEDYNKMPKFKNVEEYKAHRGNNIDLSPTNKTDAMRQLYTQHTDRETESAALAFYYAQQSEKAKKNSSDFWSGLKQINF
jgi:curved DNA-binding protein CbpA